MRSATPLRDRLCRGLRRICLGPMRSALHDPLTDLANRRKLLADLEEHLAAPGGVLLAVFDLDGFKRYNDTYGHPTADLLLRRLGDALRVAVAPHGEAYRIGGDEFCVLARRGPREEALVALARDALAESGEGFAVVASCGVARAPEDGVDCVAVLSAADQRMYAEKSRRPESAAQQARDLLFRVLREREPGLQRHSRDVTELALMVGRDAGLDAEEIDVLARAAEMHDIGKIAIPDAILNKSAALTEEEWQVMRQHTLIGERILAAAPALRPVALVVRSTHERWDGSGYPDGLAGVRIPLAARVIAVCDAYEAITGGRHYRAGRSPEQALAELRRCSGSHFDPAIVEAFARAIDGRMPAPAPAPTLALVG